MGFDLLKQNIKELDDLEEFIRSKVYTNEAYTNEINNNYKQHIELLVQPLYKQCGKANELTFTKYAPEFTDHNIDYCLTYQPYSGEDKYHKDDLEYGDYEYRHVSNKILSNIDIKFATTKVYPREMYCASIKLNNVHNFKGNWDVCFNAFNSKAVIIYVPFLRYLLNNNYFVDINGNTPYDKFITYNMYMAAFAKYEAEGNSLEGLVRVVKKFD